MCNCGHSWASHSQSVVEITSRLGLLCGGGDGDGREMELLAAEAMAAEISHNSVAGHQGAAKATTAALIMQDTAYDDSQAALPYRKDGYR